MARRLVQGEGFRALAESLGADLNHVRRIVLDLTVGQAPVAYVELVGDDRTVDAVTTFANSIRFETCRPTPARFEVQQPEDADWGEPDTGEEAPATP